MGKLFALLISIALFQHAAPLYCQPAPLTLPRVGDTIDAGERLYYRLFPHIRNFAYATVSRVPVSDSILITVASTTGEQFPLTVHTKAHTGLSSYIGNYEQLAWDAGRYDIAWQYNRSFSALIEHDIMLKFTGRREHIRVVTKTANANLPLLYADSAGIVVGNISAGEQPLVERVYARRIAYNEIIRLDKGAPFWEGAATGTWAIYPTVGIAIAIGSIVSNSKDQNGNLGESGMNQEVRRTDDKDTYNPEFQPGYNTGAPPLSTVEVVAIVGASAFMLSSVGALLFGTINSIISLFSSDATISEQQYLHKLPDLERKMFFRFGVPPELKSLLME